MPGHPTYHGDPPPEDERGHPCACREAQFPNWGTFGHRSAVWYADLCSVHGPGHPLPPLVVVDVGPHHAPWEGRVEAANPHEAAVRGFARAAEELGWAMLMRQAMTLGQLEGAEPPTSHASAILDSTVVVWQGREATLVGYELIRAVADAPPLL